MILMGLNPVFSPQFSFWSNETQESASLKEEIGPMFQLCSLWISQHAYKSKQYKEAVGHIYRQAKQQSCWNFPRFPFGMPFWTQRPKGFHILAIKPDSTGSWVLTWVSFLRVSEIWTGEGTEPGMTKAVGLIFLLTWRNVCWHVLQDCIPSH